MRRFIVHSIMGGIGSWLAALLAPGVISDGVLSTYILMGFLIGVADLVLIVTQQVTGLLLFFIPRVLRNFLLTLAFVGIVVGLVEGFSFGSPMWLGLLGTTAIIYLLFMLPFSS